MDVKLLRHAGAGGIVHVIADRVLLQKRDDRLVFHPLALPHNGRIKEELIVDSQQRPHGNRYRCGGDEEVELDELGVDALEVKIERQLIIGSFRKASFDSLGLEEMD